MVFEGCMSRMFWYPGTVLWRCWEIREQLSEASPCLPRLFTDQFHLRFDPSWWSLRTLSSSFWNKELDACQQLSNSLVWHLDHLHPGLALDSWTYVDMVDAVNAGCRVFQVSLAVGKHHGDLLQVGQWDGTYRCVGVRCTRLETALGKDCKLCGWQGWRLLWVWLLSTFSPQGCELDLWRSLMSKEYTVIYRITSYNDNNYVLQYFVLYTHVTAHPEDWHCIINIVVTYMCDVILCFPVT